MNEARDGTQEPKKRARSVDRKAAADGFERVLAPIDFSVGNARALRTALALRGAGELVLFHVAAEPERLPYFEGRDLTDVRPHVARAARRELEEVAARVIGPAERVRCEAEVGHPADAIVARAERDACDLIAMGTHGRRGPRRLLAGSVTEEVLRRAPCPVLTVRSGSAHDEAAPAPAAVAIASILAATDFSLASADGLERAVALARALGASLHLLHVLEPNSPTAASADARRRLEAEAERARAAIGGEPGRVAVHLAAGRPAREIVRLAGGVVDLIVIGSLGRTGLGDALLGSTAERVMRLSACPVLTVPAAAAVAVGAAS